MPKPSKKRKSGAYTHKRSEKQLARVKKPKTQLAIAPSLVPAESVQLGLRGLASQLSGELTDNQLESVFTQLKVLENDVEALKKAAHDRVLSALMERGHLDPETKHRTLEFDNHHVLKAIPWRTGLDPKKWEGLLRQKGLDPQLHMIPTVTFKVDYPKADALEAAGTVTNPERELCKYPESYQIRQSETREEQPLLEAGDEHE